MTDPMDLPADDDGYALVMPFITTASHGGPHDDESYVAGFEVGRIDQALAAIAAAEGDGITKTVHAANVRQLDLVAMHHGFPVTRLTHPDESGTWVTWTCRRTHELACTCPDVAGVDATEPASIVDPGCSIHGNREA